MFPEKYKQDDFNTLKTGAALYACATGEDMDSIYQQMTGYQPEQKRQIEEAVNMIKAQLGSQAQFELKEWDMLVTVSNTGAATSFYISPAMLAVSGEDGVMAKAGIAFKGIGASTATLTVTSATLAIPVFNRYIFQNPTFVREIDVTASNATGISSGILYYGDVNPSVSSGQTEKGVIPIGPFNLSSSYNADKAELRNLFIPMSQNNYFSSNIQLGGADTAAISITYYMKMTSLVPKIYATYR